MVSEQADVFRRFVNAVFNTQTALLKHGDMENAPFGQSSARWRVMLHISLGKTTAADIARSTGYTRQAVQRLADALVTEGYARYGVDDTDRRKQRIALTQRGRDTFERLEAHFDIWVERLLAQIPEAELIAVTDALNRIKAVVVADMRHMREES